MVVFLHLSIALLWLHRLLKMNCCIATNIGWHLGILQSLEINDPDMFLIHLCDLAKFCVAVLFLRLSGFNGALHDPFFLRFRFHKSH